VETATGYRVSRKAGSTGEWTDLETVHGTELNVTEEEPCVSVTYAVAVLTEEQEYEQVAALPIMTAFDTSLPWEPADLELEIGENFGRISWLTSPCLDSYSTCLDGECIELASGTPWELDDLSPCTDYSAMLGPIDWAGKHYSFIIKTGGPNNCEPTTTEPEPETTTVDIETEPTTVEIETEPTTVEIETEATTVETATKLSMVADNYDMSEGSSDDATADSEDENEEETEEETEEEVETEEEIEEEEVDAVGPGLRTGKQLSNDEDAVRNAYAKCLNRAVAKYNNGKISSSSNLGDAAKNCAKEARAKYSRSSAQVSSSVAHLLLLVTLLAKVILF